MRLDFLIHFKTYGTHPSVDARENQKTAAAVCASVMTPLSPNMSNELCGVISPGSSTTRPIQATENDIIRIQKKSFTGFYHICQAI